MRIAMTGNRPQFLPCQWDENHEWLLALKKRIKDFINQFKPTLAISGMALGADLWWAEICIEEGIPVHAYIPCPEQPEKWGWKDKKRYKDVLAKCEKQITISGQYQSDCFKVRNYAMVDNADMVVCIMDSNKTDGGTVQTTKYAQSKNLKVVNLFDGIVEITKTPEHTTNNLTESGKIPF